MNSDQPMLPLKRHPTRLHVQAGKAPASAVNFAAGKSAYVVEVDDYALHRSMLYALGAKSVANKMMAHADLIVHGGAAVPPKARAKYPSGELVRADAVLPLFRQEVRSFAEYVRALQRHGFTVRNPSDEGGAKLDFFEMPLVDGSLHATLLQYLGDSPFIRKFVRKQHFPIEEREAAYVPFEVPGGGVTWYYAWVGDAWGRVSAQRGEGDYPLEIKGDQLMRVEPVFWTQSTGMYFYEYPHVDSISGLFIQAGVDALTGRVNGAAISRVWT
ncbi:hypothetical protein WME99_40580 [Sorangium sp. So ce136]|uniref:hypothetical protein n=1 Tax=Sorangium sp. So ce136 TaxID=3133284 RepID=UPI003F0094F0